MTRKFLHAKLGTIMRIHHLRWVYLCLILLTILTYSPTQAQFAFQVEITSPSSGDAILGIVPVKGVSAVDGFTQYQVEFSIENDSAETWFNIITSGEAINNDVLAEWDTSALTDGEYKLRLTVFREADDAIIFTVNNLRIRNYTAIETATVGPTQTLVPGIIPSPTSTELPATPTNLPENGLILPQNSIRTAFVFGVSFSAITLTLLGLYMFYKSKIRNAK